MAHNNFYRRAAFQLGPDLRDLPAPAFGDGECGKASSSRNSLYKFAAFQCGPRVGSLPPPVSDDEFRAIRRDGGGAELRAMRNTPEDRSSSSGVPHAWMTQTDENNVHFEPSDEAIERTLAPITSMQLHDAPSSSGLRAVPGAYRLGESGSQSIPALSPTSTVNSNALDEATTPQHAVYAFGDVNTHAPTMAMATPRTTGQLPQPTDHCPGRHVRSHAPRHRHWVPVNFNGRRADIPHLLAALSPQQESINPLH